MNWSDILADPTLQDLPYKIETNAFGQIVMSPASNQHGDLQGVILALLNELLPDGRALVECSIGTDIGVKVPDVAWRSRAFLDAHSGEDPYSRAPEICVEVLSPSNSPREIDEKRAAYFRAGAREVWLCSEQGDVEFYDESGRIERSGLAPDAVSKLSLD
ncbi:MAG: Uma2 family endonuclease [Planctomycetota bacterium]